MTTKEFNSIVDRLKKNDNSPLKDIYEEHRSFCISQLKFKSDCPDSEAVDIFMDAILELRDRIIYDKLESISNLRAYLYGTCMQMWLKKRALSIKAKKKISDLERYYYQARYDHEEYDKLIQKENFHHVARKKEHQIQAMYTSLQALNKNCRTILKLFYFQRMKMQDIAKSMGLSNERVAITTKARCFKKWMEIVNSKAKVSKNA